ncbi:redoxin domain-containing protein [Candidatus Peribacteria bacterium]|nr:redoxin domain-containing protein [Candidatus Peribacteria bacterium]
MALYVTLFIAGMLTILLPCILPLLPIVLGVSISGRSKWRPLLTVLGMIVSFIGFTFLLTVVLGEFIELADTIRIATNYVLLLFGIGFAIHHRALSFIGAILGAFFFMENGLVAVGIAAVVGIALLVVGSRIASRIQQLGADAQNTARQEFGADSPVTAFLIGLTLGLVWVPCAGPALSFALTLVREKPGIEAFFALLAYAVGTGIPLLIIGYGGQAMTHSVRFLNRYTGHIKTVAGVLFILTAIALQFNLFQSFQVWLVSNTKFGEIGTRIEERIFKKTMPSGTGSLLKSESGVSSSAMTLPTLPRLIRAPEFAGLGPWHNSEPFTLESLRGKIVLVDFWTYSCINCIRTLPYLQGYWEKFKDTGKFVLIGVHSPEFTFEKSQKNVAMAIRSHGLTYPVAQDNDFDTWSAFANKYWPAKYLIDGEGYIRYMHFGEGEYEGTDLAIRSLLRETGVDLASLSGGTVVSPSGGTIRSSITPEIYLGSRSWPAFGNSSGEPDSAVHAYTFPDAFVLDTYYLSGSWQLVDEEHQVLRSKEGQVRLAFRGGEVNLVLGLKTGAKLVQASVIVDGKEGKTFTIDRNDLYPLFKGEYGEHEIVLMLKGPGVEAFAFTFGG